MSANPLYEAALSMNLIVQQGDLLKALSHQQSVVERKTTVPILSHVYLEAVDGHLLIKGTDLEMSLVEEIPAQVLMPGCTTVSAHMFRDLIRKFPDNLPITLTCRAGTELVVRNAFSEFALPTLPSESFPAIHSHDLSYSVQLSTKDFAQLIEDTQFAMSCEEARYSLNGIYFHRQDSNRWRAVATDAHRLALSSMQSKGPSIVDLPSIMIGRKTIYEFRKLLEEAPEEVVLSLSEKQLKLSFDQIKFSSRLLESQFPDYWQAIPQSHPHQVLLDVRSFGASIDRVSMVSGEKHRLVKFAFEKNQLVLSAHSQQYGSGTEKISIHYTGPDVFIGFNPRYLLDVCAHMKGDSCLIHFKDAGSSVLITDPSDSETLYVLMPMRI